MTTPPELQKLLDRAAIADVHTRYFRAADSGDEALMRSCFLPDVRGQYYGRPLVHGLDELIGLIGLFKRLADGTTRIATHFAGNLLFHRLEAQEAETEIYALTFQVMPSGGKDEVRINSLRYLDRWAKRDGEWKIAARMQVRDWSGVGSADFAMDFAQRIKGLPPALSRD